MSIILQIFAQVNFFSSIGFKLTLFKAYFPVLFFNLPCAIIRLQKRGVAQFGSALGSGPRGRRFKSSRSDHTKKALRNLMILRAFLICTLTLNIFHPSNQFNFYIVSVYRIDKNYPGTGTTWEVIKMMPAFLPNVWGQSNLP